MDRLGVVVIGLNGAVSSTMIAGLQLMAKGLAPRHGMLTEEGPLAQMLDFAPAQNLVFGGWDLHATSLYDAAVHHRVFRPDQLEPIKEELSALRPWKAVFSKPYAQNLDGDYVVEGNTYREHIESVKKDIESFKEKHGLTRVVMVNVASTEKWIERGEVHQTLEAFEKGLDRNDPAISPAMRYFYAANSLGIPHANFTPSLANIPALKEQAEKTQTPYAGMDGKTGQTLVKTALASMFRLRQLKVDGWYSTNFLGNNDGLVLDNPESNKTKVLSKASVLDSILGYKVDNHQVHIHYYKPRGDAKEAWDNIDLVGFGGVPMQMKINFLCQDSILAAPLVVDLIRWLDVAKQLGERGIQRQLSVYFKSPYAEDGEQPQHDLFEQERLLLTWAHEASQKRAQLAGNKSNGKTKSTEPAAIAAQPAAAGMN